MPSGFGLDWIMSDESISYSAQNILVVAVDSRNVGPECKLLLVADSANLQFPAADLNR